MKNIKETVEQLIEKQSTAIVGSIDDKGFPNIKAMLAPRVRDGLKSFYFTTNTSSMRVHQFREKPQACVYFCDQTHFKGVMLIGKMEVLEDSLSKEMIWRDGDTLYYSEGVTDPDYCVLKFTSQSGRYYSSFSSESFDL